jgi:hypothetical protein
MLKVRVKILDKEVEVSFPTTNKDNVFYRQDSALFSAVEAVKAIVLILKEN